MCNSIGMLNRLRATVAVAVAVVTGSLFGAIDTVDGVDWWFEIEDGHAIIKSTMTTQSSAIDPETAGVLEVPSELGGYPVTEIGQDAFWYCRNLTSVKIPKGVTKIGGSAFHSCELLESVSLPEGVVSLGGYAFRYCRNLRDCVLPASLREIGSSAFDSCTSLTNVVFVGAVTSVGNQAFAYCSKLSEVRFAADVGTLGSSAFYDCTSLTNVVFAGAVSSVGSSAFFKCTSLADVCFSRDVGSVGENAFYGCLTLTNVMFDAALTNIQNYAFANCEALPGISLPSGTVSIAEGAFYNCRTLKAFTFPSQITNVSDAVLAGCTNLVEVTIPEGVTTLGNGAFLNCSSLENVDLPKGIQTIEKRAFEGTAYWKMQPDNTIVVLDNYIVGIKGECPSKVVITNGVEAISANMFRDCTNLVEVVLPESLTVIGPYAFYNTGLKKVEFPSKLSAVGERAFAECHSLTEVVNAAGVQCGAGVFEHTGLATHDVVFDANKGSLSSSETNKTFVIGVPYGPLPLPTRSYGYDYRFVGWYTASKGGALVSESSIVSESVTRLYAHWETDDPFVYYVRFYKDFTDTSYSAFQALTNGVPQALQRNDTTKAGYVFAGWATEKNGPVVYADQAVVSNLTTEAGESVPLYACWADGTYDVRGKEKNYGAVSLPVLWTARLDYSSTPDEMRQTIAFKVSKDETASLIVQGLEGTARPNVELWCKASSTSQWESVCMVYSSPTSCDFAKGAEYQLRVTDASLSEGCRVYSIGIGDCVDVYFDPDGGSLAEGSRARSYIVGKPYVEFPQPNKTEADLEGWFTKSGTQIRESSLAQVGVTNLIARWAMHHAYQVSFNANGGEGTMQQASFRYGESAALPANAFVRNFYRFEGWAETAGGPVKYGDKAIVSDLVKEAGGTKSLYAVWSRILEKKVFENASGKMTNDVGYASVVTNLLMFTGTLTATNNRQVLVFRTLDSGSCRLAVDPLKGLRRGTTLGYESLITTDLYHTPIVVSLASNATVRLVVACDLQGAETYDYQVSVNATGVTVAYDLDGGEFVGKAASLGTNFNFTVGTPLGYLPTPTNREEGVFFAGWFDAASNRFDITSLVPKQDVVLTAHWTEPDPYDYVIQFKANGAEGAMPDRRCRSNVAFSLPSNAFVFAGCTFAGWAREPNGEIEYADGEMISRPIVKKADRGTPLVLYARWTGEDGINVELIDGIFWHYKISGASAEICNKRRGQVVAAIAVTTGGEITVPTELGGAAVTSIGSGAFSGCNRLTSIILPNELTSIGDSAFEGCESLKSVKFMGAKPTASAKIYAGTPKDLWSKVRLTPANRESWTTDGKMLPARWPVPESVEAGDYANTRQIGWWLDAPKDDPGATLTFYYYDGTGRIEKKAPEEGLAEMPDREDYEFGGWFSMPYGGVAVTEENYKELGVTKVYAHWVRNRSDHHDPQTWEDVRYDVKKAWTYDAYLLDGEVVVGTVQFKMAKGKVAKGDDSYAATVTAKALVLGEGKAVSLKGIAEGVSEEGGSVDLVCTKKSDEREMSVDFSANRLEGTFGGYSVVGARNFFANSTDWDRRAALAAMDDCSGSYVVVLKADGESPLSKGYVALTVTLGAKGKTKVSGTLPDGTKVSVASQLLVFEESYVVPVVAPLYSGKKGGFGLGILLTRGDPGSGGVADVSVLGVTDWTANPGKPNEFVVPLEPVDIGLPGKLASAATFALESSALEIEGASIEILPEDVTVTPTGSKWALPKADKVKFLRDEETYEVTTDYGNPAGLKLTYAERTGTFKGSFTVYAVTDAGKSKKFTAAVNGSVLNGVGYGTAVIKKVGSVPVVIMPEE